MKFVFNLKHLVIQNDFQILPMVPKIVGLLKGDNTPHSDNMMSRLAELLHIMMYLHAGFPELYDPVFECIKVTNKLNCYNKKLKSGHFCCLYKK